MTRILLLSDLHDCHIHWYGADADTRLNKLIADLEEAGRENPFDFTLILGDISLDFWAYNGGGSWQKNGESRTAHFVQNYLPRLPQPVVLLPGNHEQYGDELWKTLTGSARSAVVELPEALLICPDTFRGVLDPTEPSDGEYLPADCDFIRRAMENCPEKPVFLCSHYFDMSRESAEFKAILAENPRIKALFMGHTHHSALLSTGPDAGNLPILQTGNYSYSGFHDHPENSFWGWRELVLLDNGKAESFYHVPAVNTGDFRIEKHRQDCLIFTDFQEDTP